MNAGRFDGLDAGIELRTPALATLRPILSRSLPALTDLSIQGHVSAPAALATVSLQGVKLSAHEGDLTGDATIGLGPAVSVSAKLHATRLDLDAMLAASADAGAKGAVTFDAPLPWSMLRGPAIDLAVAADTVTYHGQAWRGVDLVLGLHNAHLLVSRLQLAEQSGAVEASLDADAATDDVPVALTMHAPGVPLALLLRGVALPGPIEGSMRVDAQLHGRGRSLHELAASLDGRFGATMTGGSLSNAALMKLASKGLQALSISVPAAGRTAINCAGLIGSFSNGLGRFPTIAVDTTYLRLSGAGQVDLRAQTLALKLTPLAQVSGSSVAVPVLVEGPFAAPQARLDASGIDKLGILIDSWFGGDNPKICLAAGLAPPPPGAR